LKSEVWFVVVLVTALLSKYISTSGARYSGVVAVMLVASSYEKELPKSISLRLDIRQPVISISMLSGFRSAWTTLFS